MMHGNSTTAGKQRFIKTLGALRFFAVMLIVVHHLRYPFIPSLLANENFGTLGVGFFLVLSGFVMTLTYKPFNRPADSLYFLWNRIVRSYPLHIVTFLACLLIFLWKGVPVDLATALINAMLLQSFFPSREIYFSFNSLSWILSTLFFFYGVFALVNHRPRLMSLVFVASLISLAISVAFIETDPRGNNLWFRLWLLYIFPPNRLSIILLGAGTASLFIQYCKPADHGRGLILFSVLELLALLLIVDFIMWGYSTLLIDRCLQAIPIPLVKSRLFLNIYYVTSPLITVCVIAVFSLEKGMITRILQSRPLLFLGNISYSIFISHQLLINYTLSNYRQYLFDTVGQPATVLVAVLAIVLVSLMLYACIENPLRTRLRISFR